jgi:hypothetical protein
MATFIKTVLTLLAVAFISITSYNALQIFFFLGPISEFIWKVEDNWTFTLFMGAAVILLIIRNATYLAGAIKVTVTAYTDLASPKAHVTRERPRVFLTLTATVLAIGFAGVLWNAMYALVDANPQYTIWFTPDNWFAASTLFLNLVLFFALTPQVRNLKIKQVTTAVPVSV